MSQQQHIVSDDDETPADVTPTETTDFITAVLLYLIQVEDDGGDE
jgi:hypothetical protein